MNPRATKNAFGTYDVYDTGGKHLGTGTADFARGLGASVDTGVPAIQSTPTMISSKDMAGQYATNSSVLDTKTLPPQVYTTPNGTQVDANGNIVSQSNTTTLNGQGQGDQKTTGGSTSKDGVPTPKTAGDIFDSIEKDRLARDAESEAQAKEQKDAQMGLLNTSLAAIDSTYRSTLANIDNTYNASMKIQTRINKMNVARTKAYGLATGNALSTPIEFTNAVSLREQEAASNIAALDNSRNSAIAAAQAARDSGNAKALESNMKRLSEIEADMRTAITNIATEATNRFNLLLKVQDEQLKERKDSAAQLLAAATIKSGDEYGKAKDDNARDSIVQRIVNESGGLLKYSDVLTSLVSSNSAKAKAKTDADKDAADLAYKKAQTNSELLQPDKLRADIAKTRAETNKTNIQAQNIKDGKGEDGKVTAEDTYTSINKYLVKGQTFPDGTPVLAPDGKITAEAFDRLSTAAVQGKVDRSSFLKQYASKLQAGKDNNYSLYNLTNAEVKLLKGELPD